MYEMFVTQIELALELDKPVIVHDRDAHADCLDIVGRYPALRGVFHCFSGSREMAEELLERGWYLGFDGPVTYKNARRALEVLEAAPLERILLETDSPYLPPAPFRGRGTTPRCSGTWRRESPRSSASPSRSWPRRRARTREGCSGYPRLPLCGKKNRPGAPCAGPYSA